jgi:antitoxin HicB
MKRRNPRIGSSFASFLREHGLEADAYAHAAKRVLAWQLAKAMEGSGITKAEMARRMKTSRAQLDRLLDPAYESVQLDTLRRAAAAVGRSLRVELV